MEYQFANINQNQVREGVGLTFARFIKHALRQDPDIIMVGEIRDRETAETAVQAALTGHLVLSTLHTNDSPTTITRLLEMGVEPYLVCLRAAGVPDAAAAAHGLPGLPDHVSTRPRTMLGGARAWTIETRPCGSSRGRGCTKCYDSGYRGRIGVYELLECDDGAAVAHPVPPHRGRPAQPSGQHDAPHAALGGLPQGAGRPDDDRRSQERDRDGGMSGAAASRRRRRQKAGEAWPLMPPETSGSAWSPPRAKGTRTRAPRGRSRPGRGPAPGCPPGT